MSLTRLTTENRFYIRRARGVLRHHKKVRPLLRAYCSCCQERWGAWGCDDRVWAIDFLNWMSNIIVDNKPARLRPSGGVRDTKFRAKINRAMRRAEIAYWRTCPRRRVTTAA